jgi:hypothetical protein
MTFLLPLLVIFLPYLIIGNDLDLALLVDAHTRVGRPQIDSHRHLSHQEPQQSYLNFNKQQV